MDGEGGSERHRKKREESGEMEGKKVSIVAKSRMDRKEERG